MRIGASRGRFDGFVIGSFPFPPFGQSQCPPRLREWPGAGVRHVETSFERRTFIFVSRAWPRHRRAARGSAPLQILAGEGCRTGGAAKPRRRSGSAVKIGDRRPACALSARNAERDPALDQRDRDGATEFGVRASFIASSLRRAKRRGNPAGVGRRTGLLRCARNDGEPRPPQRPASRRRPS
jgi:hypothetical protein